MSDRYGRVLVTCAPPNPNGDLHLGHLSGPFLGADVLRRYLRARGADVAYVSYTDDESCYVPRRAREIGWEPKETALHFTRRIEQTLALADMLPDYYEHPHREPGHDHMVHEGFHRLMAAGAIEKRELPTPYCERCEKFLYEADLRGLCRFCREPSDGTYCEDCGFPQDPGGLHEARCVGCGDKPVLRTSPRLVVPLRRFAARLATFYAGRQFPARVNDFCQELLSYGLPDTPISRISGYGTPVPLEGWSGHVLDTWFSGIFGYMAATQAYATAVGSPQRTAEFWEDPDTTLVHFIGFDCSFSHAVLWPALLLAVDQPVLPRHVISNEFYSLEGEKFSTSRGHAIWGSEFLRQVPADAVRMHLCLTNPETSQTDFSRADFDRSINDVMRGGLDAWATSVFDLLATGSRARIPDSPVDAWPATVRADIAAAPDRVGAHLEPGAFSMRSASAVIAEVVLRSRDGLRAAAGPTDGALLAGHAELLGTVAAVAAPIVPEWSRRVLRQLGVPVDTAGVLAWPQPDARLVAAGQQVATAHQPVFG